MALSQHLRLTSVLCWVPSMTRHHETVREVLQSNHFIPFRTNSPTDAIPTSVPLAPEPPSPGSLAGTKRSEPDTRTSLTDSKVHQLKKPRRDSAEEDDDLTLRGRQMSKSRSPGYFNQYRSTSPSTSMLQETVTMLERAEETGGTKTVRLTRGSADSPSPANGHRHTNGAATPQSSTPRGRPRLHSMSSGLVEDVGLIEFLQHDDRPVFAVDLVAATESEQLPIVFTNTALRMRPTLFESLHGRWEDTALLLEIGTPFADFKTWVLSDHETQAISASFPFNGIVWKASTIRKRLRILTGQSEQTQPVKDPRTNTRPKLQDSRSHRSSRTSVATKDPEQQGYFDIKRTGDIDPLKSPVPANMEILVSSSMSDKSVGSPMEVSSVAKSTTTGDSGMQELLRTPLSPTTAAPNEHKIFPIRSNPETLQPQSMVYLTDKGFFDWTRLPMSPSLPEHIQFAKSFNWASTSLGPIEEWSAELRGMCNLIMASPHPAAMYWGPEHVAIYNEPYIMLAGQKHPSLLGSRYQDAWREIWDVIEDVFEVAMTSAQATMKDDDCLFITRNGFLEETYFSWSIIPLIGDDGSVVGLYNPCFEKTRRKIAERRMITLREIGERTGAARAVSQFWSLVLEGFEYNEYDAPLVIIYSLNDHEESEAASTNSSTAAATKQCRLEGTLGVQAGHPAAPEFIDLKRDPGGFGSIFKQAITAEKPIVISAENGTLDESLLTGIEWRGFGDPSRIIVVSPIRPTTGESTLGFIVMGTNPRRPYDEDYDLFVQLLSRQLATSIASVVLFEDEIRKGARAAEIAARDRIELSNQLAIRTQEAEASENKFTRMAELAPVGMFIGDSAGSINFANDAWYDISSFPKGMPIGNKWIDYVVDTDKQPTWQAWTNMLENKVPITVEFRFRTLWRDSLGKESYSWVLASASPEKDEDGNITRVFGSITNISSQKYAEVLQRKRMEEAVELKRQQERYIDTTSHEMRNPLSAILQSSDSITSSLTELRSVNGFPEIHIEALDQVIESAQTITLCAQHQKRIVDDVLTLSKLDSAMLLVTPVDIQPVAIARRAVKMFEGELQTADIALDVRIDRSYHTLGVDWVKMDPTRLSQVLINLMTNAIKFTTTQDKRVIRMHVAASKEKPSQEDRWKLTYIPSRAPKDKDVTAAPEWGLGDPIYIHFAVQDTGRGLSAVEKKQLFQRFSQANPRTHVTYGGSGLGLFISRELVELQGGEIGVASESGKGSTFAFYVKTRRSQAPVSGSEDDADAYTSRKSSNAASKLNKHHPSKLAFIQTAGNASATNELSALSSPTTTANQMTKSRIDAIGLRVLVVEDNLINQKVLAQQLRKVGCIVSVANHGGEAIDQISLSSFHATHTTDGVPIDVVLMDLEMPVMDGMTCARTLRQMQEKGELIRHIPVIAVTANAREEQIKNTFDAGIDDVVSKPFRIPELVPKMRDVIARFASIDLGGRAS